MLCPDPNALILAPINPVGGSLRPREIQSAMRLCGIRIDEEEARAIAGPKGGLDVAGFVGLLTGRVAPPRSGPSRQESAFGAKMRSFKMAFEAIDTAGNDRVSVAELALVVLRSVEALPSSLRPAETPRRKALVHELAASARLAGGLSFAAFTAVLTDPQGKGEEDVAEAVGRCASPPFLHAFPSCDGYITTRESNTMPHGRLMACWAAFAGRTGGNPMSQADVQHAFSDLEIQATPDP